MLYAVDSQVKKNIRLIFLYKLEMHDIATFPKCFDLYWP
jgi:hypothetical protein